MAAPTLFLGLLHPAAAQTSQNTETTFQEARTLAFAGNRQQAKTVLRQLLRQSPNYQDAQILLGRIHAWNGHYDSARLVLTPLTSPESFHLEATSALTDVELWDHHPEKALQLTDFGLARDPKNQDLLYRRAKALQMLSRQPEADATLQNLLTLNPGHEQGLALAEIFKEESAKNSVYALYELDAFSKALDSWHTLSLAYTRRLKQGNLIGRAYVANRFEKTGTLVEADFYPKLNDNYYLYLNAGGSTASFFPKFRSGISLFRNMGHGFELEAGLRYLRYAENTVIYTASVSKYWGKFWFSFRPYFSPGQEEIAQSYFLTLRYYYGATDEFLGLTLGSGFSPDDRNKDLSLLPSATLQSSKIRLDVQKKIAPLLLLTGRLGLDYQEYSPSAYRNNYTVGLGLDRRF